MNLNDKIEEIIALIKDFKGDSLIMNFLKSWENNLSLIKSKIKKEELSKEDNEEIQKISSEIINSLILKWTIPHEKLEKLLNILSYKNHVIERIQYNQKEVKETSIIEEINSIIKTLKKYNNNKIVIEFIEFWNQNSILIKNKIEKNQLSINDIKEIRNIINEIIDSLSFYFIIPHKELEKLLNILKIKNNYMS
jgi:hypothetical protein